MSCELPGPPSPTAIEISAATTATAPTPSSTRGTQGLTPRPRFALRALPRDGLVVADGASGVAGVASSAIAGHRIGQDSARALRAIPQFPPESVDMSVRTDKTLC